MNKKIFIGSCIKTLNIIASMAICVFFLKYFQTIEIGTREQVEKTLFNSISIMIIMSIMIIISTTFVMYYSSRVKTSFLISLITQFINGTFWITFEFIEKREIWDMLIQLILTLIIYIFSIFHLSRKEAEKIEIEIREKKA